MAFIKHLFVLLETLHMLHSLPTNEPSTFDSANGMNTRRSFNDAYSQTTIDYDQADFDEIAKDPANVDLVGIPNYNNVVDDNDQGADFLNEAIPTPTLFTGLINKVPRANEEASDEDDIPIPSELSKAVNRTTLNNKDMQQNNEIKQNNHKGSFGSSNGSNVESPRKPYDNISLTLSHPNAGESENVPIKGIIQTSEWLDTKSNSKNNMVGTRIVTYSMGNSKKYNEIASEMDLVVSHVLLPSSSGDITNSYKILSTNTTVGKDSESVHSASQENTMASSVDSTESTYLNSAETGSNEAVTTESIDEPPKVKVDSSSDENSNLLESNLVSKETLNLFSKVSTAMFIADTSSEKTDDSHQNDDRRNSSVIVTLEHNKLAEDMLITSLSDIESSQDSKEDAIGAIINGNSTRGMSTKMHGATNDNNESTMTQKQKDMHAIRKCFEVVTDGSDICYTIRSLLKICHFHFQDECIHSRENNQKRSKSIAVAVVATSSSSSQDFSSEQSAESEDEDINNISLNSETSHWKLQQSSESSNLFLVETIESLSASLEQPNGVLEVLTSIKQICPMLCAFDKTEPEADISKTNKFNIFSSDSIEADHDDVSGEMEEATEIVDLAGSQTAHQSILGNDATKSNDEQHLYISHNSFGDETNDINEVDAGGQQLNEIHDQSDNSSE